MKPEEALMLLTALVQHDKLRFLNHRERVSLDQALIALDKLIKESNEK